jgi:2-haloalkanoic acid dehalogenase type II
VTQFVRIATVREVARWVSFDCYGTLIDWDRGIRSTLAALWPDQPSDQLLSEYHELEPLVQRDGSLTYRQVLQRALRALAAVRGLPLTDEQAPALADALPGWSAFPEVPRALGELREAGWKLGILSNTDPDYLDASIARIGVPIDVKVVASMIGSYKPGHAHWYAFRRIAGITGRDRHVHVAASLFHDIAPCAELSIPAVWVNRLGEESDLPRARELTDLASLSQAVEEL